MKKLHVRKRFVLVILCTILLTLLCAPIYSNHLVSGLWQSLYTNQIARVYIYNGGKSGNAVQIINSNTSADNDNQQILKKEHGYCAVIDETITSEWQNFKIKFKVVENSEIRISFRGPYIKDDGGEIYPVLTDYRFVSIDKKQILEGRKSFWHNQSLRHIFKAKKGRVVELSFDARKHHFAWSDLQTFYSFNGLLFFSVLISAFLISYKLMQYVSKFKLLEHNSRIDIVLAVVFVILLFVPMLRISTAEKSLHENRMLASYPKLFNNVLNLEYGKQFETWFSDRFFGRNLLIGGFTTLQRLINKYYSVGKYRIYQDDWSFSSDQINNKLSDNDLVQIGRGVEYFNQYCKEQDIKCYLVIVPRRLEFAKDKLFQEIEYKDRAQRLVEYLKDKTDLNIVYPLSEMQKANKQDPVYYKTDHHWTQWGAYAGYQALMQKIRQDFPNITAVSEEEYNISYSPLTIGVYKGKMWEGSSCRGLNLTKQDCPLHVEYKYYQHKKEDLLHSKAHGKNHDFHFDAALNQEKVILLGNSFIENISYFMAYSFANVLKRRCNFKVNDLRLSRFKPEIEQEKPDILIVLIHSEYIHHLKELKE